MTLAIVPLHLLAQTHADTAIHLSYCYSFQSPLRHPNTTTFFSINSITNRVILRISQRLQIKFLLVSKTGNIPFPYHF